MAEKRRLNLAFSPRSPVQFRAWQILQEIPAGKRADWICRLVCDYADERKRNDLLKDIRQIVREELQNLQISAVKENTLQEPKPQSVSDDVLGFLRSLQEGDGFG